MEGTQKKERQIMSKGYEKFKELISNTGIESIGGGDFAIGSEYDEYFDELFLGLTLKDNLLYIYYENCPGRNYVIYKWDKSREDFNDFVKIIEELSNRDTMISLAFHLLDNKKA